MARKTGLQKHQVYRGEGGGGASAINKTLALIAEYLVVLPVFMWRNHISKFKIVFPSEVLLSSDYRPYRNLAFYNVLARQGSSFCNRARLNFQAFALRD